jgi:CubicO group peptidase (beta-lactamase class C family)
MSLALLAATGSPVALPAQSDSILARVPTTWRKITIRHLLTHTSGIPDYDEMPTGVSYRQDYTEAELFQAFTGLRLLFRPRGGMELQQHGLRPARHGDPTRYRRALGGVPPEASL